MSVTDGACVGSIQLSAFQIVEIRVSIMILCLLALSEASEQKGTVIGVRVMTEMG